MTGNRVNSQKSIISAYSSSKRLENKKKFTIALKNIKYLRINLTMCKKCTPKSKKKLLRKILKDK